MLQAEKLAWEAQQQISSKEAMPKEKADDLLMAENHQMRAGTSSETFFILGLYIANVLGH